YYYQRTLSCSLQITSTLPRCFFLYCHATHRDLHSFPTRRSSDLVFACLTASSRQVFAAPVQHAPNVVRPKSKTVSATFNPFPNRSEEHTSELQSLAYLVCRLLLEKKKWNKYVFRKALDIEVKDLSPKWTVFSSQLQNNYRSRNSTEQIN